jgi:competence protein ComEA
MFKRFLMVVAGFIASMSIAVAAQIEVNSADQAALDGVKGLGPVTSKAILEERKNGEFKDWTDLEKRVKGVSHKRSLKLSQAGLIVNGQPKAADAAVSAKKVVQKGEDKAAASVPDGAKPGAK